MRILVLNCGSSSVKFSLVETSLDLIDHNADRMIARGVVDRIGLGASMISYQVGDAPLRRDGAAVADHQAALETILRLLQSGEDAVLRDLGDLTAVGHRIVHGGERFHTSALITPEVLAEIEECITLAPLHNPHNLRGYNTARKLLPGVPQVAVFDTSFHQSMPPHAFLYAIPYTMYRNHGVRRYGFHGMSHRFITFRLHQLLGVPRFGVHAISVHLGNGCSVTAIGDGRSLDTSMGFTPLEGLVMGSRSGDLDPSVALFLMAKEEMTASDLNTVLNRQSGLLGLSGVSSDMRELLAEEARGNDRAALAVNAFCYRVAKYIASYAAVVGPKLQAVAFTGGIGENSPEVRRRILERLEILGIVVDPDRNAQPASERLISADGSRYPAFVIPTNEELVIARDTVRVLEGVIH